MNPIPFIYQQFRFVFQQLTSNTNNYIFFNNLAG